jgi:hypothetical protein
LGLTSSWNENFLPINASKMWVKNPFTVNTENEEILQLNESEIHSLDNTLIILSLFTHVIFTRCFLYIATSFDPTWSSSGYISVVSYSTVSLIGYCRCCRV